MGVHRLWSYLQRNKHDCMENIDLVQVAANEPGGIKLLVDFYSWEHFIKDSFKSSLEKITKNPYLSICGGEYKTISGFIKSFVEALKSVNIELIFFLDGAKGSSDSATAQKWNTWKSRQSEDVRKMEEIIRLLKREVPLENVDLREVTRPCLQEVQNIITLQKLGCKICCVVAGEADTFIAQYMKEDGSVVGVFSNDTDFCIFPGSALISQNHFDMGHDLGMRSASLTVKEPKKIICSVIRSASLWRRFEFTGIGSLCELAIIAGNDFTLPILFKISEYRPLIGKIPDLVEMIKQYGCAENFPLFGSLMTKNPQLAEAVHHSREFYSLTWSEENGKPMNNIMSIVSNNIKRGQHPSSIYAMCKRFYWHRMILEDVQQSMNTAERAMVYLRSHIYSLLLLPHQDTVEEYGRTPQQNFQQMTALKILNTAIPSLAVVQRNSFVKNRDLFHRIMSHQEYEIPVMNKSYFHMYGNKLGFTCYLLRYFLLLNWQQNLWVSSGEFMILCAWLLGNHDPETHMEIKVLPSSRCITFQNWFLCLFRTSHAFLGNLLNLSHEFPTPADLFSGAVWVSLYAACDRGPEFQLKTPAFLQLSKEQVIHLNKCVSDVLKDRQHIIRNLVKGLFPIF